MKANKEDTKVLYIAFTDLSKPAASGSELRPKKMLEALQSVAGEVKIICGRQNNRQERVFAYRSAKALLKEWRPDLCYIEPPSGPLFFHCDRALIKRIYKAGIPIGLFYRDAYWRFPSSIDASGHKNARERLKKDLICVLQKKDLSVFTKCCKIVYFPTMLMASYFHFPHMEPLPPGCVVTTTESCSQSEVCQGIYVGGATKRYGVPLLIESGKKINQERTKVIIHLVCSQSSWEQFLKTSPQYDSEFEWLKIHHLTEGTDLETLYQLSDFAIIPLEKNEYHDFAFPVKLADYLSHLLPVVTTNCEETAAFVKKYDIGIVTDDDTASFSQALFRMSSDGELRAHYRENARAARSTNLWTVRAEKILSDLADRG